MGCWERRQFENSAESGSLLAMQRETAGDGQTRRFTERMLYECGRDTLDDSECDALVTVTGTTKGQNDQTRLTRRVQVLLDSRKERTASEQQNIGCKVN
jgi:hypothetical protein